MNFSVRYPSWPFIFKIFIFHFDWFDNYLPKYCLFFYFFFLRFYSKLFDFVDWCLSSNLQNSQQLSLQILFFSIISFSSFRIYWPTQILHGLICIFFVNAYCLWASFGIFLLTYPFSTMSISTVKTIEYFFYFFLF